MVAAERLAEVFVEVADTLVDDFDLIDFLQVITRRSSDLFNFSAAGLLLADHNGRLQLMAASDERAELLELFQIQAQEGPCRDCFVQGAAVIGSDLASAADRWPRFAPHAVEAGYRAVHAFPMRLRREVIGALNLFDTEAGDMSSSDALVVQSLADIATISLLQERAIRRGEVLTGQLQEALNSRIAIEQAKGALAQMHSCSTDEAFELMRRYARGKGQPLTEVATDVTTNPSRIPDLTSPQRKNR